MTIKSVAKHLGIGWDTIKEIEKDSLQRQFAKPNIKELRHIAIDEINVGKGNKYLTIVLDLQTGAVVFVGDGKDSKALLPFWRRIKASKIEIEAVATDFSKAYIKAVQENIPKAVYVFDHFHIVKLFNDKIDDIRRDIQNNADKEEKEVMKGTRWILLKNKHNLDKEKGEIGRLEAALELNKPLAGAYYLKEELKELWKLADKSEARVFLQNWIQEAIESKVKQLVSFANTLLKHSEGILAYYDFPISTGPLEGTNNKIKTLQKSAYGYRDKEFFKLKIKALYRTKYALVG